MINYRGQTSKYFYIHISSDLAVNDTHDLILYLTKIRPGHNEGIHRVHFQSLFEMMAFVLR